MSTRESAFRAGAVLQPVCLAVAARLQRVCESLAEGLKKPLEAGAFYERDAPVFLSSALAVPAMKPSLKLFLS